MLLYRERYLSRLRDLSGLRAVKAVTGMRNCGKSTIVGMFISELKAHGVPEARIFYVDVESAPGIRTEPDLRAFVRAALPDPRGAFVFLDEAQCIGGWEGVAADLFDAGADVYVIGSSMDALSPALAGRTGPVEEVRVHTLSLAEYAGVRIGRPVSEIFEDYVVKGSLPSAAALLEEAPDHVYGMHAGMFYSSLLRDVAERNDVRDLGALSELCIAIMESVGTRASVHGLAERLASVGRKTGRPTIESYLALLERGFMISRIRRWDARAGDVLRTASKYYATDTGVRNFVLNSDGSADMGALLENVVFNELARRHSEVYFCATPEGDVDFVADPLDGPCYYQVITGPLRIETLEAKLRPLRWAGGSAERTVLMRDDPPVGEVDGVRLEKISDWLVRAPRRRSQNLLFFA